MNMRKKIPVAEPDLSGHERKYLDECLESGWISSKGPFIEKFENQFADFTGSRYAVATSNGTTALHLALVGLGIGAGAEVIVPDLTFIASANAVTYTGAKPVLVDVDRKTWNIDPALIENRITNRTKAILAVHLYGRPADMSAILKIAGKHRLSVIEDAAEAHGAEVKIGRRWLKAGNIGDMGCFSFFGNKIITTGEGGMVTTDRRDLADKIRILRDHGQAPNKKYYHPVIGFNYRMTNLQAAIGVAQMERIRMFLRRKRENAVNYTSGLQKIPGIKMSPENPKVRNVYWMYSVVIDGPYPKTRDEMAGILAKSGIESRPFFIPVHRQPPYREDKKYPVSDYLAGHGLSLPSGNKISRSEVKKITQIFQSYAGG